MTPLKTETLVHYLLIALSIIISAMVISSCGGGGGDSSTSGTPNIGLVSAQTDFGVTVLDKSADKHIEIWNTGSANLSIGQITQPASPFSMNDSCSGVDIPPSSKCQLTIHFAPTVQGDYSGSFDNPKQRQRCGTPYRFVGRKGKSFQRVHQPRFHGGSADNSSDCLRKRPI